MKSYSIEVGSGQCLIKMRPTANFSFLEKREILEEASSLYIDVIEVDLREIEFVSSPLLSCLFDLIFLVRNNKKKKLTIIIHDVRYSNLLLKSLIRFEKEGSIIITRKE